MKTCALIVLIPVAMLAACGRKDVPPASTTATAAPAATAAAATAEVTLSGTPDNGMAPGTPTAPTNPAAPNPTMPGSTAPANPAASSNASTSSINGTLQLAATADGVTITGNIIGLAPNTEHGFHVHETGDCATLGFATAGGHFNPDSAPHGNPTTPGNAHHLGDIPELKSDGSGNVTVNATITGATLRDGGAHDLLGKSLIVHAKRDDYSTQPSGDSGDRIACGVIK